MRQRALWIAVPVAIVVLGVAGYGTYLYEAGNPYEKLAQSDLEKHQFAAAKTEFQAAENKASVFFSHWQTKYDDAVNQYGNLMLQQAKGYFAKGQFTKEKSALSGIPTDFSGYQNVAGMNAENPLNFNVKNNVPPDVTITKTVDVLVAPNIPAVVLTGTDMKQQPFGDGIVYVFVYDPSSHGYKLSYSDTQVGTTYHVQSGLLFHDSRQALVLVEEDGGSGAFAGAVVLSVPQDGSSSLTKYLNVQPQPQAGFSIKEGTLVDSYAGLAMQYSWDGTEFLGKQVYSQPTVSGNSVEVHYSIAPDGTVTVTPSMVTLSVGQKLVLIRDDTSSVTQRIMLDGMGPVDFVQGENNTFIGKASGSTDITIIPDGYDWNNAQKVMITVK